MQIHKVTPDEYDKIHSFYFEVIDGLANAPYHPEWKKDIYPAPDQLHSLIAGGELFAATENGKTVCVFALNNECNEDYDKAKWNVRAKHGEVFVIHILAVHPSYTRQGKAKKAVCFAIEYSRSHGAKAVRLDVIKGNIPANRLYESTGFKKVDTVTMFYPDTGYKDFELYELEL